MSDTLADLSSWLPSDFLSGDFDHIKPPHFPNHHHRHNHFPYDVTSSSSTESESDDDELTGLTRRFTRSVSLQERLHNTFPFQKKMGFSGSCPTTPFPLDNEWEQLHAAAERVARMKMQIMNTTSNDDVVANRVDIVPPRHLGPTQTHNHHHHPNCAIWRSENEDYLRQLHFRNRVSLNGGGYVPTGRPVGFRQSAWPTLPVETPRRQQNVNVFVVKPGQPPAAAAPVKKECAGTGVFLPRSYSPNPPEIKKKAGGCYVPVNRVMNKNINMGPPQPTNIQQYPYSHYPPHHHLTRDELAELVMARRNAMMLAQQRRICTTRVGPPEPQMGQRHPEALLPQEWTY